MNLLSVPLELVGQWEGSLPSAAAHVVSRMREVSLDGVRLLSDRQPVALRVDDHSSGPPSIWLHQDQPTTAWVIVDIGARDWCRLAYQFGHELGHVLCNSWEWGATPRPRSQWLEEAIVEAFSLHGLARLAESWERNPPFPGDQGFAEAIRQYRRNMLQTYQQSPQPGLDAATWFQSYRDREQGVGRWEGPAILGILALMEADPGSVEDLGAVNRWPGRAGIAIEQYLPLWEESCQQIGACGHLPAGVRGLFQVA